MADPIRTSDVLVAGQVYTRVELAEMFDIRDATLNTGIFLPKGHMSVWLFVTENKTTDRTQYVDQLQGDTLRWQGQTMGAKDALIIEHEARARAPGLLPTEEVRVSARWLPVRGPIPIPVARGCPSDEFRVGTSANTS